MVKFFVCGRNMSQLRRSWLPQLALTNADEVAVTWRELRLTILSGVYIVISNVLALAL